MIPSSLSAALNLSILKVSVCPGLNLRFKLEMSYENPASLPIPEAHNNLPPLTSLFSPPVESLISTTEEFVLTSTNAF